MSGVSEAMCGLEKMSLTKEALEVVVVKFRGKKSPLARVRGNCRTQLFGPND